MLTLKNESKPYLVFQVATLAVFTVVSVIIGVIASNYIVVAFGSLVMVSSVIIITLVYKRPIISLYIFIFFLPLHFLGMVILYAQLGFSSSVVRALASWKEGLLLCTFITVWLRVFLNRRIPRFTLLDGLTFLWFFQILFYLFFHNAMFDWESDWSTGLYGARDWLLYLVPFIIGRLVPIPDKQTAHILKSILIVGLLISITGLVDYLFVPVEWHISLGVAKYYKEVFGQEWQSILPYWTYIAGASHTRRITSIFFSGQNFALAFLLIMPIVIYNYHVGMMKHGRLILMICSLALLLSITRTTIIVCLIQSLSLLWLFGRKKLVFKVLIFLIAAFSTLLVLSPGLRVWFLNTITFQEASAAVRPKQWIDGLENMINAPLGHGLASTGVISQRLGTATATVEGSEAGYFKITGALGLPGLFLWFSWFIGIMIHSLYNYYKLSGLRRGVVAIILVSALGIMLNNLTAPPDQSLFVIYIFPWLAGLTVRWTEQIFTDRDVSAGLSAT